MAHLVLVFGGVQLVLRASIGDGDAFDAAALGQYPVTATEIYARGRQGLQAFLDAGAVVVGDESLDAVFALARKMGIIE